jgi:hypothetical protein
MIEFIILFYHIFVIVFYLTAVDGSSVQSSNSTQFPLIKIWDLGLLYVFQYILSLRKSKNTILVVTLLLLQQFR